MLRIINVALVFVLLSSCRTTSSQVSADASEDGLPTAGDLVGYFMLWGYPKPGVFKYSLNFKTGPDGKITGTWKNDTVDLGDSGAGPDPETTVFAEVLIENELMFITNIDKTDVKAAPDTDGAAPSTLFRVTYQRSRKAMLEYPSGRVLESATPFKQPKALKGVFSWRGKTYEYHLLYDAGEPNLKAVNYVHQSFTANSDGSRRMTGDNFFGAKVVNKFNAKDGVIEILQDMELEPLDDDALTPELIAARKSRPTVKLVVSETGVSSVVIENEAAKLIK